MARANICESSMIMLQNYDASHFMGKGIDRFNMVANLLEASQVDVAEEAGKRE